MRKTPEQVLKWIAGIGIEKAIQHWAKTPGDFCQDILRMKPQEWQEEFMQAVSNARYGKPNDGDEVKMRFAVKSGTGVGKALRHGEPVLTPTGWKVVERIKVGDLAIAPDGSWTKIVGVYPQGEVEIYRVEFDDGCFVDVCGDHLWSVNKWSKRKHGKLEYETLTTREMVGSEIIQYKNQSARLNYMIPKCSAVNFKPRNIHIDPYTVGVFLGDGSAVKGCIWTDDEEIFDYIPYKYHKLNVKFGYRVHGLTKKLNRIGVLNCRSWEKYVPDEYKFNTVGVRLAILQGLMDTDGTVSAQNKNVSFCSVSKQLAEDVAFLVRSLGGKVSAIREKKTFYNDKNGDKIRGRLAYNVNISMPDQYNPFKLKRKANMVSQKGSNLAKQRYIRRYIKSIKPICRDHATCIEVDHPSHLFLTKDFIVTHNTSGVACLVLWHLGCFADSKIPCTAPTSPQIKAVLWPELRKWVQNIPPELKEYFPFEVLTDSIKLHENLAIARTAREESPEAFQGFHSKNILLLADEASGIPDAIFLAGQGVMSSKGAITILIGNPTRPAGWFYDAFHSDAHLYWRRTINCTMSSFVQDAYVEEMRKKHGQDSYEFRVRVMGEFHLEDSGFIVPRSWAEAAIDRIIDNDTDYVIWGVDVSAGGKDKSAIAKRRGNELLEPIKTYGGVDIMQFVGITLDEYYKTPMHMRPDEICVDLLGVGYGYVGRLKEELKQEIDSRAVRVRGINVAERKGNDRYVSLRVELWAKTREWFESMACKIPNDPEFINEICSVEWEIKDSSGKWFIPDKKTGGKSPDRADAFNLTMAGRRGATKATTRAAVRNRNTMTQQSMYATGNATWLKQS